MQLIKAILFGILAAMVVLFAQDAWSAATAPQWKSVSEITGVSYD